MKKELPKIYKGKVNINSNRSVAHGVQNIKNPKDVITELFKKNKIYKQNVEIETNNNKFKTKIIGRTNEHIITIDNEVIKIDDIKNIIIL